jgi:hypothetical protein
MTLLSAHALNSWLVHCADPLGLKTRQPRRLLSPNEASDLVSQADAHGILPAIVRNFPPLADDPDYAAARHDALVRQRTGAALAMMLRHEANALISEAKDLPVALVKGHTFARTLYPEPALRPFTDIDLLVDPAVLPRVSQLLDAHRFRLAEDGQDGDRRESKWLHRDNDALLVEVHTNLVHAPSLRGALSLTYADIADGPETPAALLTIASMHGGLHHFERLRQVVDICQAARHLKSGTDEAQLQGLLERTGSRLAAITGLNLANRLFGEPRCREIASALGPERYAGVAKVLIDRSVVTSTMSDKRIYHSWRRQGFRELLKRGKRR